MKMFITALLLVLSAVIISLFILPPVHAEGMEKHDSRIKNCQGLVVSNDALLPDNLKKYVSKEDVCYDGKGSVKPAYIYIKEVFK